MVAVMEMPTPVRCPALDPATEQLVEAVRVVLRSPCIDLPAAQSLERLRALTTVGAQLTALQAESVRDCTLRDLYALDGAGSTNGWLRQQPSPVLPGAAPAAANRLGRLSRVLQALRDGTLAPRSAEAVGRAIDAIPDNAALLQPGALAAVLGDGITMVLAAARGGEPDPDTAARTDWDLLQAQLEALAHTAERDGTRARVHDLLEQGFLALAERLPAGQVSAGLERLVDALRPDRLDEQAESAHDSRSVTLNRNPDGHGWRLTAELDDETGELASKLFTAYDRIERDSNIGRQGLIRSKTQRRHDALSAAIRFALESGDVPADGGIRPHIAVTVSTDQLAHVAGSLPAQTDNGCSIPHATLSRWLCDSDVTMVLLSDKSSATGTAGHPLDVGRTWRTATPQQRLALRATWAGCAIYGCGRGWKHLTPHHVIPWHLGGTTDLDNLLPVCDGCHHDLHEDRRRLRLQDDRWIGPEGWVTGPPG